jgi:hypothetical protein
MTFRDYNFPKDKVFNRWLELNPDWDIEFSDDNECLEYIDKHFGQEYVDLFNYITNGPNKADVWRLCKLYVEGGVYSDIDIIPLVSIEQMVDDVDLCTCKSIMDNSLFQAFIYVKEKNNPIIKECLVSLLNNKYKYKWRINSIEPTIDMYKVMVNIGIDVKVGTYESNNLKVRFLDEYTPIDDFNDKYSWVNSYVRLNGINVMKSRDVDYHNAKMEKIVWQ